MVLLVGLFCEMLICLTEDIALKVILISHLRCETREPVGLFLPYTVSMNKGRLRFVIVDATCFACAI